MIDLFRRDYLQLIYLMIISLKQIPVLARRKNNAFASAGGTLTVRAQTPNVIPKNPAAAVTIG